MLLFHMIENYMHFTIEHLSCKYLMKSVENGCKRAKIKISNFHVMVQEQHKSWKCFFFIRPLGKTNTQSYIKFNKYPLCVQISFNIAFLFLCSYLWIMNSSRGSVRWPCEIQVSMMLTYGWLVCIHKGSNSLVWSNDSKNFRPQFLFGIFTWIPYYMWEIPNCGLSFQRKVLKHNFSWFNYSTFLFINI